MNRGERLSKFRDSDLDEEELELKNNFLKKGKTKRGFSGSGVRGAVISAVQGARQLTRFSDEFRGGGSSHATDRTLYGFQKKPKHTFDPINGGTSYGKKKKKNGLRGLIEL